MKKPVEFPLIVKKGSVSAKIYSTPTRSGYDSYTLVYYQDSVRKREVFGDLNDAKKRGGEVVGDISNGEIEASDMTSEARNAYNRSLEIIKPTGMTLESVCREYVEAFELSGGVSPVRLAHEHAKRSSQATQTRTVRQVVDEFLKAKQEGRATRLRGNGKIVSEKYLYQLGLKLDAFAARFDGYDIDVVSGQKVNDWIHGMEKASGRTKNNYLQALNVLYEFAKKQRYVARDHAVLDEVDTAAETDFDIEIFTPTELKNLLTHAPDSLLPVLLIGAFAGLRTAEIERLDWSEINLSKKFIEVKAKKAKTRARRLVPITDGLLAWLKPMAKEEGKIWEHSLPYLFELQRDTAADAGVKWKHNALRHSFITYRVAEIKNVDKVALEAGNSPDIIFQHYRELVSRDKARAWFGLRPSAVVRVPKPEKPMRTILKPLRPANLVDYPAQAAA